MTHPVTLTHMSHNILSDLYILCALSLDSRPHPLPSALALALRPSLSPSPRHPRLSPAALQPRRPPASAPASPFALRSAAPPPSALPSPSPFAPRPLLCSLPVSALALCPHPPASAPPSPFHSHPQRPLPHRSRGAKESV